MDPDPLARVEIPARLNLVKQEIALAAEAAGRDPADVKLVAVTKTVPPSTIEEAIGAGQRMFGENRVQEAREAVAHFDVIETLDRAKLARALAEEMARAGKRPRLFVQVNTGEEAQKAGVLPAEVDALVALCRDTFGLTVEGLRSEER